MNIGYSCTDEWGTDGAWFAGQTEMEVLLEAKKAAKRCGWDCAPELTLIGSNEIPNMSEDRLDSFAHQFRVSLRNGWVSDEAKVEVETQLRQSKI